jgi:hypothetical protein
MNTTDRNQAPESKHEGAQDRLSNPQMGHGHDFDLWVDLPGGICEVQCRETKRGPRFYYWSGYPYGRWIPCKASEVIFRNIEDKNHG